MKPNNKPSVGRIVHYVSYGTPGGEYQAECRAAVVTHVHGDCVSLAVLNPTGMFFNEHIGQDEEAKAGGTWHWPERDEDPSSVAWHQVPTVTTVATGGTVTINRDWEMK